MKTIGKLALTFSALLGIKILRTIIENFNTPQQNTLPRNEKQNISKETHPDIIQNDENRSSKKYEKNTNQKVKKSVFKYFAVDAKVGHIGKNKYMIKTFSVYAENGKAAAEFVRNSPRVKHNHKDAIRSVTEISQQEFTKQRKAMHADPYFNVTNIQEQRAANIDIENAFEEEAEISFKNHKHSLRKNFHEDEQYFTYRNYHGSINSEDIA